MPDDPDEPEDPGKGRLLPGEENSINSANIEAIRHWVVIYRELLGFKQSLLEEIATQSQGVQAEGKLEIENDRKLIQTETDRVARRLMFWEKELKSRDRS